VCAQDVCAYVHVHVYIYIYIYVCVCVCVCSKCLMSSVEDQIFVLNLVITSLAFINSVRVEEVQMFEVSKGGFMDLRVEATPRCLRNKMVQ